MSVIIIGAILDSNLLIKSKIKTVITSYFPNIKILKQDKTFTNLLDFVLNSSINILIVDIDLDENTSTLKILSELVNIDFEIIFISSSEKQAVTAINHHNVSSYLIKPIQEIDLIKALTKAIKARQQKRFVEERGQKEFVKKKVLAIPSISSIEF